MYNNAKAGRSIRCHEAQFCSRRERLRRSHRSGERRRWGWWWGWVASSSAACSTRAWAQWRNPAPVWRRGRLSISHPWAIPRSCLPSLGPWRRRLPRRARVWGTSADSQAIYPQYFCQAHFKITYNSGADEVRELRPVVLAGEAVAAEVEVRQEFPSLSFWQIGVYRPVAAENLYWRIK